MSIAIINGKEIRKLHDVHRKHLHASGINDGTIEAAGIYSEHDRSELAQILNRQSYSAKCGSAIIFPYIDSAGDTVLKRVRPDHPNGRGKYLSPSGSTARVYFPPGVCAALNNVDQPIVVTEGEKKALSVTQSGHPTIGLMGTDCWHSRKSTALLPDLERINWSGRTVYIAFDSDAATNPQVRDNERLLAAALAQRGAIVKTLRLPAGSGGEKVGIDDWLVRFPEAERGSRLHNLLLTAAEPETITPDETKRPANEMDPATEGRRIIDSVTVDCVSRLRYWRGSYYWWERSRYVEQSQRETRPYIVRRLNESYFQLGQHHVGNVMQQIDAATILRSTIEPPHWFGKQDEWNPADILVTPNALIHLPTFAAGQPDYRRDPTPRLFTLSALTYEFNAEAAAPTRWLEFLSQLWSDDSQSIELLQMWFGYCLTLDTSLQKMLLLIGPKRSGKGTIARILRALVGSENMAGPTLASLGERFGLWPLLGKSIAIFNDARLSGRTDQAVVVERLLSISGEDALTVDRKSLEPVTAKIGARLMIVSNELPRLGDSSGALTSRLIVLQLRNSFLGHEVHDLTDLLLRELPGILLWAIDGWQRLRDQGRFVQPDSSRELIGDMDDLSSPIGQFVRESCAVGPGYRAYVNDLYGEWCRWCSSKGRKEPGTEQTFGRDLMAHLPALSRTRPRDGTERRRAYEGIALVSNY